MKLKNVFIMIPSLIPTGPVRGAVALCNGLLPHVPVTLVVLKPLLRGDLQVDERVEILQLGKHRRWTHRRQALRRALDQAGGRQGAVCISFCLSADYLSIFTKRHAFTVSSVRGNLPMNYRYDYGPAGLVLAWLHLVSLNAVDQVVAMSNDMALQMRRFGLSRITVIGNFVDESALGRLRMEPTPISGPVRLVFLASLTKRKRPDLVLQALKKLKQNGQEFHLDIVGDGPLRPALEQQIQDAGLHAQVAIHGHLDNPYALLQQADYMLLPSESEGISRACLEALFFGVPCVVRDVDANRDLITSGVNGELFHSDKELAPLLGNLVTRGRRQLDHTSSLLPVAFRQDVNVQRFLELIG